MRGASKLGDCDPIVCSYSPEPRGRNRRWGRSSMPPGSKTEVLRHLTFGNEVAEEEREALRSYFVKTQIWDRIYAGQIDVVYGQKGSGKSAIYALVSDSADDLFDRGVLLIPAENPRGTPAFRDLAVSPPATEREFISIWKLYFLSLVARELEEYGIRNTSGKELASALQDQHLLPTKRSTLGSILSSVRQYVRKMLNPKGIEGGLAVSESGMVSGITGKITFEEPNILAQSEGFVSIDDLLHIADNALGEGGVNAWIILDRLDVAFDESSDLERNALRALFRAYSDMRGLNNIKVKIFLRTDIWNRITEGGFREATHISRNKNLTWDKASLQNLVVRRLLTNPGVVTLYGVDPERVLSSAEEQKQFFERVFPNQVEVGEKQSSTIDWVLRRTSDGTSHTQPRDIIFLLNRLSAVQNQRLERGEQEPPGEWLFERAAFKEALPALSEYRINQVLYAEYATLRPFIEAMREQKTEQNARSLARLWAVDLETATNRAKDLRDIGFFEERTGQGEPTYWVPFVYRSFLQLSQGKADEIPPVSNSNFKDIIDVDE